MATYEAEAPMSGRDDKAYADEATALEDDFFYGTTVGTSSAQVRLGFLRKVYGILAVQVFATILISALFMAVTPLRQTAVENSQGFLIVGIVGSLGTLIAMFIYKEKYPTNYYLLAAFTFFESLSIGLICGAYQEAGLGRLVFQAAMATLAIFVSLSAYCYYSKKDFSFLGGFLFAGLCGLLVVGFLQLLFGRGENMWVELVVSIFGVLVFSGYILYDTSQIMHTVSPDEYIGAVISLYLDILNLFLYILRLLSVAQRN